MADKLRDERNLQSLQARYIGIGSTSTTAHEFHTNVHRDSLNSFIGHPALIQYASIGLGQTRERTRVQFLERMIRPVGRSLVKDDEKSGKKEKGEEKKKDKVEDRMGVMQQGKKPHPKEKYVADEFGFGPNGERVRF